MKNFNFSQSVRVTKILKKCNGLSESQLGPAELQYAGPAQEEGDEYKQAQ